MHAGCCCPPRSSPAGADERRAERSNSGRLTHILDCRVASLLAMTGRSHDIRLRTAPSPLSWPESTASKTLLHFCIAAPQSYAARLTERTLSIRCTFTLEDRSEERRVGKECVSTCRSRGSTYQ